MIDFVKLFIIIKDMTISVYIDPVILGSYPNP